MTHDLWVLVLVMLQTGVEWWVPSWDERFGFEGLQGSVNPGPAVLGRVYGDGLARAYLGLLS